MESISNTPFIFRELFHYSLWQNICMSSYLQHCLLKKLSVLYKCTLSFLNCYNLSTSCFTFSDFNCTNPSPFTFDPKIHNGLWIYELIRKSQYTIKSFRILANDANVLQSSDDWTCLKLPSNNSDAYDIAILDIYESFLWQSLVNMRSAIIMELLKLDRNSFAVVSSIW